VKILGIFNVGLGLAGWVLGFFFSQPSYLAAGHTALYSLGQIAVILGPLIMITGVIMFALSTYHKISIQRPPDQAPTSLPGSPGFSLKNQNNGQAN
jgi:hypothetical protein